MSGEEFKEGMGRWNRWGGGGRRGSGEDIQSLLRDGDAVVEEADGWVAEEGDEGVTDFSFGIEVLVWAVGEIVVP